MIQTRIADFAANIVRARTLSCFGAALFALAHCAAPARSNPSATGAAPSSAAPATTAATLRSSATTTPSATLPMTSNWPSDLTPASAAQLSALPAAGGNAALDLTAAVDRCIALRIDAAAPARVMLQVGTSKREFAIAAGSVLLGDGVRHCIARRTAANLQVLSGSVTATALVAIDSATAPRTP